MINKELSANRKIELKASLDDVWDALINPEKISQYLFGTNVKSEWKKGCSITFSGEWEGHKYHDKGTILEIREKQLLQYTYLSDMSGLSDLPENYIVLTFKMGANGNHTTLELEQQGAKDEDALKHSMTSWDSVLQTFKETVEN